MPLSNLNVILITNNKLDLSYSSNTTISSCMSLHYYINSCLYAGPFGLVVSKSVFLKKKNCDFKICVLKTHF